MSTWGDAEGRAAPPCPTPARGGVGDAGLEERAVTQERPHHRGGEHRTKEGGGRGNRPKRPRGPPLWHIDWNAKRRNHKKDWRPPGHSELNRESGAVVEASTAVGNRILPTTTSGRPSWEQKEREIRFLKDSPESTVPRGSVGGGRRCGLPRHLRIGNRSSGALWLPPRPCNALKRGPKMGSKGKVKKGVFPKSGPAQGILQQVGVARGPGNRLKGGGVPPSPPTLQPRLYPKGIPIPQHQPQPHFQPPETARSPHNRFHIPCDRSATALGLP